LRDQVDNGRAGRTVGAVDSTIAGLGLQGVTARLRALSGSGDSRGEDLGAPTSARTFDPFGDAYREAVLGAPAPTASAEIGGSGPAAAALELGAPAARATRRIGAVGAGRSVGQIGGYGAMTVPATLAGYRNGRLPSTALVPIGQGGHRLAAPAAEAWKAAVGAAAADGIRLRITDSYRSYDNQVILAAEKGLSAQGGWAATPGKSNHGWGLAVDADVRDPATLAWLRANGHRFGFVEASTREPWHWEYRPTQA
jgi:hypothetical protein